MQPPTDARPAKVVRSLHTEVAFTNALFHGHALVLDMRPLPPIEEPNLSTDGHFPPGNIYYFQRFGPWYGIVYTFVGGFLCAGLTEYGLPRSVVIATWFGYVISLIFIWIILDPRCCITKQTLDEVGQRVTLHRPLFGWKCCEHRVRLETLASGRYDWDHGFDDARFRDVSDLPKSHFNRKSPTISQGQRYGLAYLRL